ncbi:hypothetical protein [Atlantibacter hermannii]|uniref:hypothetical protein n=1 Tax=Atlantibacter hermannii TaxID=565 RepID=UPI0034D589FE
MFTDFLLTYSVEAQTSYDQDIEKANKVRRDIADLDIWEKIGEVETTFKGRMNISGATESEKKKSAKKVVEEQFLPILRERKAGSYDVKIHCALMTGNIEKPFDFTIED